MFFTGKPVAPPNIAVTQEFDLFDDNDDGDQWPDEMPDDSGLGTFQRQPASIRGWTRTATTSPTPTRTRTASPTGDEPFLFFWGDPPEFIYDIDMNNNGLPDLTENDDEPDYPLQARSARLPRIPQARRRPAPPHRLQLRLPQHRADRRGRQGPCPVRAVRGRYARGLGPAVRGQGGTRSGCGTRSPTPPTSGGPPRPRATPTRSSPRTR